MCDRPDGLIVSQTRDESAIDPRVAKRFNGASVPIRRRASQGRDSAKRFGRLTWRMPTFIGDVRFPAENKSITRTELATVGRK